MVTRNTGLKKVMFDSNNKSYIVTSYCACRCEFTRRLWLTAMINLEDYEYGIFSKK